MKYTLLLLIFLTLLACEKPNPTPETSDPVYQDMQAELNSAESALKSAEKELEGFKLEVKKVIPQSSQLGAARERMYQAEARTIKTAQMIEYWKIKIESRRREARKSYLQAWKEKKPWPDPTEFREYSLQKKLQSAPQVWSVKRRLEQAGVGIPIKPPGGSSGESHGGQSETPAAEPKSEH